MSLLITKAKPNPAGKDRLPTTIPATQLAAEWVDFQNTGASDVSLANVKLYHMAYPLNGKPEWDIVMSFQGGLQGGKTVRVHSGDAIPLAQMRSEDQMGADFHLFTGKNYVWNNSELDRPALRNSKTEEWLDKTEYDAYPPEGRILKRLGIKLV